MDSVAKLFFLSLVILSFTARTVLAEAKAPPYFVKQPSGKEILFHTETNDNGSSLEIPCEAEGIPAPRFFWTKNGEIFNWTDEGDRISQETGKGTLKINVTKSSDAGQYQCFAENIWGTATSNSVFAREIDIDSFRNEPMVTIEAVKGQPFSLTCKPLYGYPTPNVDWMKQDLSGKLASIMSPRISADPTGTLWFSNVTEKDASHDYVYICVLLPLYSNEMKMGEKVILKVVESKSSSADSENAKATSPSSLSNNDHPNTNGVPPVQQNTSNNEEIKFLSGYDLNILQTIYHKKQPLEVEFLKFLHFV